MATNKITYPPTMIIVRDSIETLSSAFEAATELMFDGNGTLSPEYHAILVRRAHNVAKALAALSESAS